MILARAPLRISFFGGGTDHPEWYKAHGGHVLSTTINKYVYLKVRRLPHIFPFKHRVVWRKNEQVETVQEIEHPVVRTVLQEYYPHDRFEILYFSDVPALSGLGSSSAFTVALLHGLACLKDRRPSAKELAQTAIRIERDILKEPVGDQDQIAAAYGGFNLIHFHKKRLPAIIPMTFKDKYKERLEDHLLLYFTGLQREAGEVEAAKLANFTKHEDVLREMQKMTANAADILRYGNMATFGQMIFQTWCLKKILSAKVSNIEIDEKLKQAMQLGAYGGKLLGAGGGGFLLIVAPPTVHAAIQQTLGVKNFVNFKFTPHGSQVIETGWQNG